MLLAFLISTNVNSTDFSKKIYDNCQARGGDDAFVQAYILGYGNAFRYQLRDLKMRMDAIPNLNHICHFYINRYKESEHKGSLFFNIIIESEILRVNNYEYKDYQDKKLLIYKN